MSSESSTAGSGGTARVLASFVPDTLGRRAVSALVLMPVALIAVYAGRPYFDVLALAAAVRLAWEWTTICDAAPPLWHGTLMIAGSGAACLSASGEVFAEGMLFTLAFVVLLPLSAPRRDVVLGLWLAVGLVYIALPVMAVLWLRGNDSAGSVIVVWLLVVVWASDIGAYATGRLVGGPRLAPTISPNKTWAGLVGGIGLALIAGIGTAAFTDLSGFAQRAAFAPIASLPAMTALTVVVVLAAQGGDLAESAVKRHFKVKDASDLIPGHGGALDRLDALLFAAAALVIAIGTLNAWVIR